MKIAASFGVGAIVLAMSACGSTSTPTTAAPVATTQAAVPTAEPTAEAPTAPAETVDAVALVKMPNAVGMVLQDAQDLMQKVTDNPAYFTKSHDLRFTRMQILDNDWKVCTQNVEKGKKFNPAATKVDFGVVKLDERCP